MKRLRIRVRVREEERDACSYSCLSFVVSRRHAVRITPELQTVYAKMMWERKNGRGFCGTGARWAFKAQRGRTISNDALLMSGWSLRKAGGRGLCVGSSKATSRLWLHVLFIQTRHCGIANIVSVKKEYVSLPTLMKLTVYMRLSGCIKLSDLCHSTDKKARWW